MANIIAFGEPLVGFYPTLERDPNYFRMTLGGDTSNLILQLAKLGYSTKYITRIGTDYFADYIRHKWEEWNVDCSDVKIDPVHSTGVYFVIFDENKKHHFIYKRENSASANYLIGDAEEVVLSGTKIFHFSGITQAISKSALEASFYFAKKCKENNILISYDLNYREPLWGKDYFSSIASYTIQKYADIVTLNFDEAKILKLTEDPEK